MRRFELVPFGRDGSKDAVACDGLVSNSGLDVSHWKGSATPDELRADTSVEMALKLAESDRGVRWKLVVNNHFDADGVLAVFCLLHPEIALAHRSLLIGTAEAGDFDERPSSDESLMLEMAIARLARLKSDAHAYERVLEELPTLVPNIAKRHDLWGTAMEKFREEEARARTDLKVTHAGPIAILTHRGDELPGPILSRASNGNANANATRWLLAFEHDDGSFDYRYEMRRWSWAETVFRPRLASPSRNALVQKVGDGFAIKGDLGMTGLLRSTRRTRVPPEEIAALLRAGDKTAA